MSRRTAEPEAPKAAAPKKAAPVVTPVAEAAPTLATLTLGTDVPGASVFIDRQFVGNTPLTLDKLEPGTKRLQITATGFDSVQKSVDLVAGPNVSALEFGQRHMTAIDVVEDGRDFHASPPSISFLF